MSSSAATGHRPSGFRTVGILGTGLIGTSIGLRARAAGARTIGYDERPEHGEQARAIGALDRVAPARDECFEADVLVLATPLEATLELLAELRRTVPPARLVLDVCSVKVPVASAGRGLAAFVPSHPMAGSERSGPQAARGDLFEGRVWMHAPGDEPVIAAIRAFILWMGACPLPLDPADHDRIVALTSHLPQLLSLALAGRLGDRLDETGVAELCGPGMRSMLRLAGSSWAVWRGVLAANGEAVAQEVRGLTAILTEFARVLEAGEEEALAPAFDEAAIAVQRLNEVSETR